MLHIFKWRDYPCNKNANNNNVYINKFVCIHMGKSLDNSLFYTKNKDGKMDIYNTAYANLILNKLGKTFSDVTYTKVNEYKQSDGSFQFDDCEEDTITSNYLACLALEGYQNIDNVIVDEILALKQDDTSFLSVDNTYYGKDVEKYEIEQTYMAIYMLKQACYEISEMRTTLNWLEGQLKKYSKVDEVDDLKYITYLIKTIKAFDKNRLYEININDEDLIESYISNIVDNKNVSLQDIDNIYYIAYLEKENLIYVSKSNKSDLLTLLEANMNTDILNMKALYEIIEAYTFLGNKLSDTEEECIQLSLLGSELNSGGLCNSSYIGTPRETLMVLALDENMYNEDEKDSLNNWMNVTLKSEFSGSERKWDNGDVYSMIALKHLLNQKIENSLSIKISLKEEITGNLSESNWREWFYAVKTLQLLNYQFKKEDLPNNYKKMLINLDRHGYMKFSTNTDLNQLINAMVIDGLASMQQDYEDIYKFEKQLIEMSNTPIEDPYFLKKRYYSIIALMSLEKESFDISNTLELASLLKYNYGYKSDESASESDIQTTFQMKNLITILERAKNEEIFR